MLEAVKAGPILLLAGMFARFAAHAARDADMPYAKKVWSLPESRGVS